MDCLHDININEILIYSQSSGATVMPTKSDSDIILCLQLLSKK